MNRSAHASSSLGLLTALSYESASVDTMIGQVGLEIRLIVCTPIGGRQVLRSGTVGRVVTGSLLRHGLEWTVALVSTASCVEGLLEPNCVKRGDVC